MNTSLAAILLAGGQSQRMGQPKAALRYQGRSFREQILETLGEVAAIVLEVGGPFGVPDRWPGAGPIAGIATAWQVLPPEIVAAVVVPIDVPMLGVPFYSELLTQWQPGFDFVFPRQAGRVWPLPAVYGRGAGTLFAQSLEKQERRGLGRWAGRLPTRLWEVPSVYFLQPMNTPAEYAKLQGFPG
ncbi:MAG: molybdenum cofactor guanylyltransferase [Gemmataceae bacterium]